MNKSKATIIGAIVVETYSVRIATAVALAVSRCRAVRGRILYNGKLYRWSTLQQFEQHRGFVLSGELKKEAEVCPKYPDDCKHEWELPVGVTEEENQQAEWPMEVCSKCGITLIRHIFTEAP